METNFQLLRSEELQTWQAVALGAILESVVRAASDSLLKCRAWIGSFRRNSAKA